MRRKRATERRRHVVPATSVRHFAAFRRYAVRMEESTRSFAAGANTTEAYVARLRDLLRYIDAHLADENLSLEHLSQIAHVSKFHLQRQFAALFGIGPFRYVQLTRLKRAAHQLAFRSSRSVLEIALESGYEAPEAFARAFKKLCGQSPSEFRSEPRWDRWQDSYEPIRNARITHMKPTTREQVEIVDFPETSVAVFEHRGDPGLLGETIRRFIDWRKRNRLPPSISATFNILYDDPEDTEPEEFRFDLCAEMKHEIGNGDPIVKTKSIPAGRCAVLRHVGSDNTLGESIRWLYSDWLPQSGESLRDFPLFLRRVRFFPDVPEHEAISDIYLPLE